MIVVAELQPSIRHTNPNFRLSMQAYYRAQPWNEALSKGSLSASHASQSLRVVGSSPILLTFHIPKASARQLVATKTSLTPSRRDEVPGVSKLANVRLMVKSAVMGFLKSIKTIIIEKIWRELPVIYMPNPISSCCRKVGIRLTNGIHGQALCRGNGYLPSLLQLQSVHLLGRRRFPCRSLVLGVAGLFVRSRVAWGVGDAGVLRRRGRRRVEVEDPLRRRRRGYLKGCHVD